MNQISRHDAVARARKVGPVLLAHADTIERERRLPAPVLDALHDARLFRMFLPRAYGGEELHPAECAQAVEEVSRHDGSTGWCLFTQCSGTLLAPYLGPDAARAVWGDPRATSAWGPPNGSEARAVPGGYVLTGRWRFASGCRHAAWMGAHGPVHEADGSLRLDRTGKPVIRSFMFPAHEARLIDDWNTMGLRGTASDSYEVRELFVPEPFSGTREDPSARNLTGKLWAFGQYGLYTMGSAAVALGIARGMLDEFAALARDKTPRGLGRLADSPVVQTQLAQTEARLLAARAFLLQALCEAWDVADETAPLPLPRRLRVRLASLHAIETAAGAADYAFKAAGSDAIFPEGGFERRFRDMHTLTQQTQARLANFEPVGRILLGAEGDWPLM